MGLSLDPFFPGRYNGFVVDFVDQLIYFVAGATEKDF
jgi:hypothetical protein